MWMGSLYKNRRARSRVIDIGVYDFSVRFDSKKVIFIQTTVSKIKKWPWEARVYYEFPSDRFVYCLQYRNKIYVWTAYYLY